MRIHTALNEDEMKALLDASGASITFHRLRHFRSKDHEYGWDVVLAGSGSRGAGYADGTYRAATWDEHGAFLGALFRQDVNARVGGVAAPVYDDARDFHWQTTGRFMLYHDKHMPPDAHPRHVWSRDPGGAWCKRCSAEIQF